jgi:type IV secretion system protein VirB1
MQRIAHKLTCSNSYVGVKINWLTQATSPLIVDRSSDLFCSSQLRFIRKSLSIPTIAAIFLLVSPPRASSAVTLSQSEFTELALRCAPQVSPETLEAVARIESGLDPWAIHDNTTKQTLEFDGVKLASAQAEQWVRRGDSVDVGLMQINAANLPALGMTVATALDPCAALAGGAAVLRAAYGGGETPAEQQVALLIALSRYNTGTPLRGIMNGYARTVLQNTTVSASVDATVSPSTSNSVDANAPPSWNVSATGKYAQVHGASWLIELLPATGL